MKVNSTANNEVLTNSNNESKFSINASAQAFRILSDGIYEHKIAAIVRELSCNAYDAHVEAGKKAEPFKVVLPNNLHPYFEIEDYGVGLDDDGVRTVYTSYFTSTKNDSNDAIGAFGLGSKTPFAYTSNFTIRARKDGVERLYTAYIGEDGAPTVNLMIERPTQESNGVKITVPVREADFGAFKREAEWILCFFSTSPVVNDPNFQPVFEDVADEIDDGGIVVRNKKSSSMLSRSALYNKRIYAVMGGVCYGVDSGTLQSKIEDSAYAYLSRVVLRDNGSIAFLKFDIGEIEVAASRETLSYDYGTDTLGKVVKKFEEKINELKQEDEDTIDAFSHPVEAMEYVEDKYQMSGIMGLKMFSYKGRQLDSYYNRLIQVNGNYPQTYIRGHHRSSGRMVTRKNSIRPEFGRLAGRNVHAVYYDHDYKKVGIDKHSRLLLADCYDQLTMVISFEEPLTEARRKRIDTYLGGNVTWHNLKDLREDERQKKANGQQPSQPRHYQSVKLDDSVIRAVSYTCGNNGHHCVVRNDVGRIDLSDGKEYFYAREDAHGFLVSTSGFRFPVQNAHWIAYNDNRAIEIVSINSMNERKVMDNGVRSIDDFFKEFFDNQDNHKKMIIDNIRHHFDSTGFSDEALDILYKAEADKFKSRFDSIKNQLGINDFSVPKMQGMMSLSRVFRNFYDHSNIEKQAERIEEQIEDIKDDAVSEYPLLDMITGSYMASRHESNLIDYIKMVDEQDSEA